ncbi:COQ9 family protein [Sphingosinicella microcystinivorans]|uniref:COQ9 family protein n=1 Tax=Sphingosinicella microcystinivorans TaxID=335406 RepID=UPI0022F38A02|nr:COQ9 family protein [Sphingosinicella microcystinivorans]WBX86473.1 COQ9 family protein [Sphingosinicella microcystinivorans]
MTETIAPADMTLDELRPVLVEALLPSVAFDGWGEAALDAAAAAVGIPADRARLVFPGGAADMIDAWILKADRDMAAEMARRGAAAMKIRDRIATAVRIRIEQARPHKEAVRRALAVLALPQNAVLSARTLWRSADAMWRAAGDTATDFNHYTKRLSLGGVYAATLLYWLQDESGDDAETFAFLDRRIETIMQVEKTKARFRERANNRPRLSRFLGRLRYPAA